MYRVAILTSGEDEGGKLNYLITEGVIVISDDIKSAGIRQAAEKRVESFTIHFNGCIDGDQGGLDCPYNHIEAEDLLLELLIDNEIGWLVVYRFARPITTSFMEKLEAESIEVEIQQ